MSNDNVRNINVGQCVGTIFACLFACLIAFVPFTFGDAGFVFFKDVMPNIGFYDFVKKRFGDFFKFDVAIFLLLI